MSEDLFAESAPVAWQLLLESDRELSACAASLFILSAVKSPQTASEIMHNDLKHTDPGVRLVLTSLRVVVLTSHTEGNPHYDIIPFKSGFICGRETLQDNCVLRNCNN